jgi:hypothetical protein
MEMHIERIQYLQNEEVRKQEKYTAETVPGHCVNHPLFWIWKTETQGFQYWH